MATATDRKQIYIDGATKDVIAAYAQQNGFKETALVDKLLSWFLDQEDMTRQLVLGTIKPKQEIATLIAKLMADKFDPDPPMDAVKVIKAGNRKTN